MKMKMAKKIWQSVLVLGLSFPAICCFAANSVDPNALLSSFEAGGAGSAALLSSCRQTSNIQNQYLLMVNPSADPNLLLLICVYGLNTVNAASCLGQSSASCQPVTLLVPTMSQITQSQGSSPSMSSKLNSSIY
jgi:hypothetical protein